MSPRNAISPTLERELTAVLNTERYGDITTKQIALLAKDYDVPTEIIQWLTVKLSLFEHFDAAHAAGDELDFELLEEEFDASMEDLLQIYEQWSSTQKGR